MLLFSCDNQTPPATPDVVRPPDVLIVMMDTVRADALSAHGNPRITSRQFDAIAAQGVRFSDATAPGSWTWPSHGSLFSGLWPWEHGAHFAAADTQDPIQLDDMLKISAFSETVPTLAEQFQQAGYQTISISANPLISAASGMARGFEIAQVHSTDAEVIQHATTALQAADERPVLMFINLFGAHAPYEAVLAEWVTPLQPQLTAEGAPEWLAPFLLPGPAVRLFEPVVEDGPPGVISVLNGEHTIPPEGWSVLRDLYDGEVMRVDYFLGQAVNAWNAAGRSGVLAITSDHGEYFGEHGLLDHGRTLYREVTHVPLAIVAPGRLPASRVIDTPVPMHALHGTLLQLADIPTETMSLMPTIDGQSDPLPVYATAHVDPFFSQTQDPRLQQPHRMLRDGQRALIIRGDGSQPEDRELYDLQADPQMTNNIADQAEDIDALTARLLAEIPALNPAESQPLNTSTDLEEALERLGYIEPTAAP